MENFLSGLNKFLMLGSIILAVILGISPGEARDGLFPIFLIIAVGGIIIFIIAAIVRKINEDVEYQQTPNNTHQNVGNMNKVNENNDSTQKDKFDKLEQLYKLKEKGALSEEEFQKEKSKLLS